ncbi:hypothetical protein GF340_00760 [Candidatus Peregrinibacteria bacterium]|nr:hypothetical protein [Candidatus Peregrinibacteria bacterium]
MVTFSVAEGAGRFRFTVPQKAVMRAGSRNRQVGRSVCAGLLSSFTWHGFSFFVGCAQGVDKCFREAITGSPFKEHSFVACAFEQRVEYSYSRGLIAEKVVPDNLPPKAALHRRTVWMASRSSMLLLFPEDPTTGKWGKGSTLAFETAMYHNKPVFVAEAQPPQKSEHYCILPSRLFAIVDGYWIIPHAYKGGGEYEEF